MDEKKIDERDFTELEEVEQEAVYLVRDWGDPRKDIVDFWDEVRNGKNKHKIWKREKDRLEFKVAKQELKTAYISTIKEILNTPWYEFPWYYQIIFAPIIFGLKGVNCVLQKMAKFMGGDL